MKPEAEELAGNFYSSDSSLPVDPDKMEFTNPADKPLFSNPIDAWHQQTKLYGDISVEVFPSGNGKYYFAFCKDKHNRAWIGAVENAVSTIQSTGLKDTWINGGSLIMPAYQYFNEAGDYGNYDDIGGQRNEYVDMFKKYLSKIPIIQEYLQLSNKYG